MVPFSFAGETFFATASGALYRPAETSLFVADLHLEKASWFARLGQFLPPYDSHATLSALAEEIGRIRPSRVFCLGDSFHDTFGCDRLAADARALLQELMSRVAWIWIVGNHDPELPRDLGGTVASDVAIGPLVFRHEPTGAVGEIAGHLHPKARVSTRGRSVERRCFASDTSR